MRVVQTTITLLAILGLCTPMALAELPSGEALMDKMAEASGGKKMSEIKTVKMSGTMEMPSMGIKGDMVLKQKAPDKAITTITMHGIGEITQGYSGDIVWENNALQGARILEGNEAEMMKLQSNFRASGDWRIAYQNPKTTGEETFNGKACYVVDVDTKFGVTMTMYVDKETSLANGVEMILDTQMGKVPMTMTFDEYKKQDGMQFVTKMTQKVLTQEISITFNDVEFDQDIDDGVFALPEAVQALVDKKKAEDKPAA